MINGNVVAESYNNIRKFNNIAENLQGDMIPQIDNQLGYIFEEFQETVTALEERDAVELLDGAVDVWVTVVGLLQKLEVAGFNVAEAIKRVDENNLSKFPAKGKPLVYSANHHAVFNEKYQVSVIKDVGGKVRKPSNFKPVDLSDLVPKDFFQGELP